MADFEKLAVWRAAHEVCLEVYRLAQSLPADQKFELGQQLRRAAYSVPSNIAEGNERPAADDFAHFMDIALGSAAELRYFLILARDLGHCDGMDVATLTSRLAGLARMLREFRDAGREARRRSSRANCATR